MALPSQVSQRALLSPTGELSEARQAVCSPLDEAQGLDTSQHIKSPAVGGYQGISLGASSCDFVPEKQMSHVYVCGP